MSTRHSHWTSAAHSFNIHNSHLETLSLASGGDGSQIITLSSIVLHSSSGQYYHKADEDKTPPTGSRMCDKMCPPLKTIVEVHRVWIYLFNIIMEHQRQPSSSSSAIDDPCLSLYLKASLVPIASIHQVETTVCWLWEVQWADLGVQRVRCCVRGTSYILIKPRRPAMDLALASTSAAAACRCYWSDILLCYHSVVMP